MRKTNKEVKIMIEPAQAFIEETLTGTTEISKKGLYDLRVKINEYKENNEYLKRRIKFLEEEIKELKAFKEKAQITGLYKNDARLDNCMYTLLAIKRSLDENSSYPFETDDCDDCK